MGGSVNAIEQGFIQEEIARSAYAFQRGVENKEKIIVGLNQFQTSDHEKIPVFRVDDSIRQLQVEKLKRLRKQRSNSNAENSLARIREYAVSGDNLMPAVIEAVESYCTLGEIADTLRSVFGEYRQ